MIKGWKYAETIAYQPSAVNAPGALHRGHLAMISLGPNFKKNINY